MTAAALLLAACDIGDIRRPGPSPSSAPSSSDVRHAAVPVPAGYSLRMLTFVDASHGFALYTRCDDRCAAILLATVDGGLRWAERRHPKPYADDQQMIVGDGGTILLLAEPDGWYRSTDDGRTFVSVPPAAYPALFGRYGLEGGNQVVEYADDQRWLLPRRLPLTGEALGIEETARGGLWVVALERGRPVLAYSPDGGRTWRREEVPGRVGWLETAWLEVSPDRTNLWLLGQPSSAGWPLIWRFDGARWREQPVANHPGSLQDVVAVGFGVLLVSRAGGGGLVDGRGYRESSWPLAGSYLRVLRDGTLMAAGSADGGVALGIGTGLNRRWIRVTLAAET